MSATAPAIGLQARIAVAAAQGFVAVDEDVIGSTMNKISALTDNF